MYSDTGLAITDAELQHYLAAMEPILAAVPPTQASFMPVFDQPLPACLSPGRVTNLGIRLIGLRPSQQIVGHFDQALTPIPCVRYHIPLLTNPACWSFAGKSWSQLIVGRVYRLDISEWHGAVNWGAEVRVHLMIDRVKEDR